MDGKKILRWAGPLVGLVVLLLAAWVLDRALGEKSWEDVLRAFLDVPGPRILLAIGLTCASYLVLGLFDLAAMDRIGRSLPWRWAAFTGFVGYALGFNIGVSALSGGAIRYRIYSRHGLTAGEVSRVVANIVVTMWIGYCFVAGLVLVAVPFPIPDRLEITRWTLRAVGGLLLAALTAYLLLARFRERPVQVWRWRIAPPSLPRALLQTGLGTAQWLLVSGAIWVCLPHRAEVGFLESVGIYAMASVAGVVSHVPGGLGVIESVFVYSLEGRAPSSGILGSILVFRTIYFIGPLLLAGVFFLLHEILAHSGALAPPGEAGDG